MSKPLKSRPLSHAKIASIMAQNPTQAAVTVQSPPPVAVKTQPPAAVQTPPLPSYIALSRKEEFDSLLPEENLREFLAFARNTIARYEEDVRRKGELEQETQDLLHYIELSGNMNACKGNEMYKRMASIRRDRRACKNEIELLKPLYEYLQDKTIINKLAMIQGQCKSAKETISRRKYTLRTDVVQ